jgi:hypothetical protein
MAKVELTGHQITFPLSSYATFVTPDDARKPEQLAGFLIFSIAEQA